MSATQRGESPRQWLTQRQSATVDALLDAALAELRESGWEALTIRSVAQRAGLTHTTAYSYFSSKGHLVTELHWRLLRDAADPEVAEGTDFPTRVEAALREPTLVVAAEPELAHAIRSAEFGDDPDIRRIREAIADELDRRMRVALGRYDSARVREVLLVAYSGAILYAGIGTGELAGVETWMAGFAELLDLSRIDTR